MSNLEELKAEGNDRLVCLEMTTGEEAGEAPQSYPAAPVTLPPLLLLLSFLGRPASYPSQLFLLTLDIDQALIGLRLNLADGIKCQQKCMQALQGKRLVLCYCPLCKAIRNNTLHLHSLCFCITRDESNVVNSRM